MPENLYRKWRPRSFAELAGQEHVTTTLVNALAGGRVAHAYLFAGPRGTGKTTTGRLLAKALNCRDRKSGEPCNRCESCLSYLAGRALDLIELDAASNRGIDEIRSLRDKVAFAAGAGDFKVYLIDEVHMLTDAAFNALLKTLEEPPPHVVFVLATTDAHRVPATIVSRCQRFDFRRIAVAAAVKCLRTICDAEGFTAGDGALELIARSSTGSMRDAENLLEQLVTSYGTELTLEHVRAGLGLIDDARAGELARLAIGGDLGQGLALIAGVRDDGLDLRQFQREVVSQLRALVLVKSGAPPVEGFTAEQQKEMAASVASVPVAVVLGALKAFGEADLKPDPNSTLPLDLALAEGVLSRTESPPPMAATGPAPPAKGREASSRAMPPAATVRVSERDQAKSASAERRRAVEKATSTSGQVSRDADSVDGRMELKRRIWEDVDNRAKAKASDASVATVLRALLNSSCDIIGLNEGEAILGFRYELHTKKMNEPKNLEKISEVINLALGREVKIHCSTDSSVESWLPLETHRSPLVRAAQEMGARILTQNEE